MPSKARDSWDVPKIAIRPDGDERFLAAVHAAAKNGPKHRAPKAASKQPTSRSVAKVKAKR